MGLVKKEVEICKETQEVLELLVGIVKCIKKKEDWTSLVDELVSAVEGMSEIPDEVKSTKEFISTIGLSVADFVEAFSAE